MESRPSDMQGLLPKRDAVSSAAPRSTSGYSSQSSRDALAASETGSRERPTKPGVRHAGASASGGGSQSASNGSATTSSGSDMKTGSQLEGSSSGSDSEQKQRQAVEEDVADATRRADQSASNSSARGVGDVDSTSQHSQASRSSMDGDSRTRDGMRDERSPEGDSDNDEDGAGDADARARQSRRMRSMAHETGVSSSSASAAGAKVAVEAVYARRDRSGRVTSKSHRRQQDSASSSSAAKVAAGTTLPQGNHVGVLATDPAADVPPGFAMRMVPRSLDGGREDLRRVQLRVAEEHVARLRTTVRTLRDALVEALTASGRADLIDTVASAAVTEASEQPFRHDARLPIVAPELPNGQHQATNLPQHPSNSKSASRAKPHSTEPAPAGARSSSSSATNTNSKATSAPDPPTSSTREQSSRSAAERQTRISDQDKRGSTTRSSGSTVTSEGSRLRQRQDLTTAVATAGGLAPCDAIAFSSAGNSDPRTATTDFLHHQSHPSTHNARAKPLQTSSATSARDEDQHSSYGSGSARARTGESPFPAAASSSSSSSAAAAVAKQASSAGGGKPPATAAASSSISASYAHDETTVTGAAVGGRGKTMGFGSASTGICDAEPVRESIAHHVSASTLVGLSTGPQQRHKGSKSSYSALNSAIAAPHAFAPDSGRDQVLKRALAMAESMLAGAGFVDGRSRMSSSQARGSALSSSSSSSLPAAAAAAAGTIAVLRSPSRAGRSKFDSRNIIAATAHNTEDRSADAQDSANAPQAEETSSGDHDDSGSSSARPTSINSDNSDPTLAKERSGKPAAGSVMSKSAIATATGSARRKRSRATDDNDAVAETATSTRVLSDKMTRHTTIKDQSSTSPVSMHQGIDAVNKRVKRASSDNTSTRHDSVRDGDSADARANRASDSRRSSSSSASSASLASALRVPREASSGDNDGPSTSKAHLYRPQTSASGNGEAEAEVGSQSSSSLPNHRRSRVDKRKGGLATAVSANNDDNDDDEDEFLEDEVRRMEGSLLSGNSSVGSGSRNMALPGASIRPLGRPASPGMAGILASGFRHGFAAGDSGNNSSGSSNEPSHHHHPAQHSSRNGIASAAPVSAGTNTGRGYSYGVPGFAHSGFYPQQPSHFQDALNDRGAMALSVGGGSSVLGGGGLSGTGSDVPLHLGLHSHNRQHQYSGMQTAISSAMPTAQPMRSVAGSPNEFGLHPAPSQESSFPLMGFHTAHRLGMPPRTGTFGQHHPTVVSHNGRLFQLPASAVPMVMTPDGTWVAAPTWVGGGAQHAPAMAPRAVATSSASSGLRVPDTTGTAPRADKPWSGRLVLPQGKPGSLEAASDSKTQPAAATSSGGGDIEVGALLAATAPAHAVPSTSTSRRPQRRAAARAAIAQHEMLSKESAPELAMPPRAATSAGVIGAVGSVGSRGAPPLIQAPFHVATPVASGVVYDARQLETPSHLPQVPPPSRKPGTRKGKLDSSERARVDFFLQQVIAGKLVVFKGELAKQLREFVNPDRAQSFYEKLISRRKLNQTLLPLLQQRRNRTSNLDEQIEAGVRGVSAGQPISLTATAAVTSIGGMSAGTPMFVTAGSASSSSSSSGSGNGIIANFQHPPAGLVPLTAAPSGLLGHGPVPSTGGIQVYQQPVFAPGITAHTMGLLPTTAQHMLPPARTAVTTRVSLPARLPTVAPGVQAPLRGMGANGGVVTGISVPVGAILPIVPSSLPSSGPTGT